MKRYLAILVLALSVSGCANIKTAFDVVTTPVTVTPAMVYQVENSLKAVTTGLVAYRRLCIKKVIDPVTRNCRSIIVKIQAYTVPAAVAIVDLRTAVAANNQVSAVSVYGALQRLITNIQSERQIAGVK